MQFVLWRLEAQQDWSRDALFAVLKALADAMALKPKVLFAPLFVALSGERWPTPYPTRWRFSGRI
jgi:glutamyl-tRNA synthetase